MDDKASEEKIKVETTDDTEREEKIKIEKLDDSVCEEIKDEKIKEKIKDEKMVEFKQEDLPFQLPLYYNRLFPLDVIYKWLSHDNSYDFSHREVSFTLFGDIYLRYQSFKTANEFANALFTKYPVKIDIGAIYQGSLKSPVKIPIERELVFDIDMTDYDSIRTCCSKTDICAKCWQLMPIACKILDASLRIDFGFKHILWVFSGRRGIHCWVSDKNARCLNNTERIAVAEYLQVISGGFETTKMMLGSKIHPSLKRALDIIDEYFETTILQDLDILGSDRALQRFLNIIHIDIRAVFAEAMKRHKTTKDRWNIFLKTFQELSHNEKLPKFTNLLVEEIKLYYSYPRLDINVTKGLSHLLKAPFCVHPSTGKISVPFKAQFVDSFDPNLVPNISQLISEIEAYDAQTFTQLKGKSTKGVTATPHIKDYKKTSLLKYVNIFNEFLHEMY